MQRNVLRAELGLQLRELLVEDERCHLSRHIVEDNDVGEAVDELGLERLLHCGEHGVAARHAARESDAGARGVLRSGVGGHDDDGVAEVGTLAVVVGERGVVHHLQEDVEDVGVRLFYLVEEQHAVGRLAHGCREQSAVFVAHVSCRRTDELRHGVLLGVLAHVEAHELHAHSL